MALILSDVDIVQLLKVAECIDPIERAYRDVASCRALSRPRSDIHVPLHNDRYYILKSMEGVWPADGIAALRINSQSQKYFESGGKSRKLLMPSSGNVILLFNIPDGDIIALIADNVLQKYRVAATAALGARHLARPQIDVLCILGSGWQSDAHLEALLAERPAREIRVYSPNREHREAFINRMSKVLDREIRSIDDPEEALRGADLVATVTNSIDPVIEPSWLSPGAYVVCVKPAELGMPVYHKADVVVANSRNALIDNYIVGHGEDLVRALDPTEVLGVSGPKDPPIPWEQLPTLPEVINGQAPGRNSRDDITCFFNNIGLGIQFAAVGSLVLRKARESGIGREVDMIPSPMLHPRVNSGQEDS